MLVNQCIRTPHLSIRKEQRRVEKERKSNQRWTTRQGGWREGLRYSPTCLKFILRLLELFQYVLLGESSFCHRIPETSLSGIVNSIEGVTVSRLLGTPWSKGLIRPNFQGHTENTAGCHSTECSTRQTTSAPTQPPHSPPGTRCPFGTSLTPPVPNECQHAKSQVTVTWKPLSLITAVGP
ncbi:hypothetical protein Q8A67_025236 [Cirrhinus molitorella]|uniref:Uncharacterized protein n=1 Tax=Cirrhinus molitorella TaxID=172907 RepID=A0AA88TBB7_9TELE|nr:hypothetical protein Q8A67_025236 [Cirrhinus molitorella]